MRIYAGGREVEIPTDASGNADVAEVRRAANVPEGRLLIQQKPTGENLILPKNGSVTLHNYDQFMDSPRAVRG
jgi:hypothetical protein